MFYYIRIIDNYVMRKIILLLLSAAVISCGKDGGSTPQKTVTIDALVGTWVNQDYPVLLDEAIVLGFSVVGTQKIRIKEYSSYYWIVNIDAEGREWIGTRFTLPNSGVMEFTSGIYFNAYYKVWFNDGRLYFKFDKTVPADGPVPNNPSKTLVYEKVAL